MADPVVKKMQEKRYGQGIVDLLAKKLYDGAKKDPLDSSSFSEKRYLELMTRLYSPENVQATRDSSLYYQDRPVGDYADKYFNNLPFLTVPGSDKYITSMSDKYDVPGVGKFNRLEQLAGEMLALQQKAYEKVATPEELQLLDTYQQFMTSRTGM